VGRIDYVEQNPVKEKLPPQEWAFVVPYDNFPFHKQAAAQADARRRLDAKASAKQAKAQAKRRENPSPDRS
jgi:hypothetical protein